MFQQVATSMPSRPEPYLEMAAIHTRLGEPEKAKAILEQAQKMGASSPEGLLNIGISYFNKKEYEKAGGMFRQVLAMPSASASDQAMAHALVGKLLLRDGKNNEAITAMEKSLGARSRRPSGRGNARDPQGCEEEVARASVRKGSRSAVGLRARGLSVGRSRRGAVRPPRETRD